MTVTTSDRDAATERAEAAPPGPLLEVEALQTFFTTRHGVVKAVDGMSFALAPGETLAIVGESGCGKSITALSLMRLVPDPPGRIMGGSVKLAGVDLIGLDEEAMRGVRGKDIAMIFQETIAPPNPGPDARPPDLGGGAAAGAAHPRPGLAEGGRHAASGAHLGARGARRGLSPPALRRPAPAAQAR